MKTKINKLPISVPVIFFLLALALCAPSGMCAQDPAADARPELVIDQASHDFGKVKEGAVLEHAFKISNKGNAVLEIKDVKPT